MRGTMKLLTLFSVLFLAPTLFAQNYAKTRVPLLREGTKIVKGEGQLTRKSPNHPIVIELPRKDGRTKDRCIVLPNRRLAEMELAKINDPDSTFRVSGDVFAHNNHNYVLIREVVSVNEHAERNHPTTVPIDPTNESLDVKDYDDSVSDIVKELEDATGSLVRSIRIASEHPIVESSFKENTKFTSRRCHLIRNDSGSWIAVFVSDATGLSDPPCTIMPNVAYGELTEWMKKQNPSTPVLLSGEIFDYHGHGFMLVRTWRAVHNTDHLDN